MRANVVGIDFGTSNSTCAIFDGNTVSLTPLEGESKVLPSVLFFPTHGPVLFGKQAIAAYIDGEEGRLLRGLKSILGTSLMSEKTIVGKKSRRFDEILSIYIANLKRKAEDALAHEVNGVVLGRPVHFHDNNPDADDESQRVLRDIAMQLGFKDVHFQYEPIAAAYAHEQNLTSEKIAIVVDLGGGTSDFTVIKLSPDKAKSVDRKSDILATTGVRVGGTNFDKSLSLAAFMPALGLGTQYHSDFDKDKLLITPSKVYNDLSDWPLIHQAQSPKSINETRALLRTAMQPDKIQNLLTIQKNQLGHALLQKVEQTKIALSNTDICDADLNDVDLDIAIHTDKAEFLHAIDALITKIKTSLDECLTQSGCRYGDIGLVILTGGSSELPIINTMVRDLFPQAQISKDDKFGSVGRGLAYNAAQLI